MSSIHYRVYQSAPMMGGSPMARVLYSPADQAMSARIGSVRVQELVHKDQVGYMRIGVFFPVLPQALPEENGSGEIMRASA